MQVELVVCSIISLQLPSELCLLIIDSLSFSWLLHEFTYFLVLHDILVSYHIHFSNLYLFCRLSFQLPFLSLPSLICLWKISFIPRYFCTTHNLLLPQGLTTCCNTCLFICPWFCRLDSNERLSLVHPCIPNDYWFLEVKHFYLITLVPITVPVSCRSSGNIRGWMRK